MQDKKQLLTAAQNVTIRKMVFSKLRGYVLWSHDSQGEITYSLHGWGIDVTGIKEFFVIRHPFYYRNRYVLTGAGACSTFLIEINGREYRQLSKYIQLNTASENLTHWLA